jgi:hypothetical protein
MKEKICLMGLLLGTSHVKHKDELQRAVYTLSNTAIKYNLKISINMTKSMVMKGNMTVRTKTVTNNHIIEQVHSFNYLGYTIIVTTEI